jgi:hypothetical protein
MKHFTLRIVGLTSLDVSKFSCRKVSTAQAHARKLIAVAHPDLTLNMTQAIALNCGDGQSWLDIGAGFKRMASRAQW